MSEFDALMADASGVLMDHLGTRKAITITTPDGNALNYDAIVGRVRRGASESSFGKQLAETIGEECQVRLPHGAKPLINSQAVLPQYGVEPFIVVAISSIGSMPVLTLRRSNLRRLGRASAERK